MKSFSFTADELQTGRRLDAVLTEKYGDFSRSQWSKQLKLGLVKIDGKLAKSSDKIKFEAKIGNQTVFVGGEEDITSICHGDESCSRIFYF